MADNASRDENLVPTLLAVSSADGVSPVKLKANATTGNLLVTIANAAVADGTYTVGLGTPSTGTNGTITITDGIITAIQEAS